MDILLIKHGFFHIFPFLLLLNILFYRSSALSEGCPIYPHRVEPSIVGINSSHRKSSGRRLSIKYTKDMGKGRKSRRLNSPTVESLLLVLVKVDLTYWKSSGERLSVKYTKDME